MTDTLEVAGATRSLNPPRALAYSPALDGIRAVAILLVMLFHARVPGFEAGFVGVDVFFVLSGYLITTILLAERERSGAIQWRRFVLRRIFRLAPALAALCLGMLVLSAWTWPSTVSPWLEVALAMTYLSDLTVSPLNVPQALGHSWSLSVEEHFYLVWPAALLMLPRGRPQSVALAILGLYLLASVWRVGLLVDGTAWREVYFRLDTRLSGLMFGGLLSALVWAGVPGWLPGRVILVLSVVGAAVVLATGEWRDPHMLVVGVPVIEIATAGVILACLSGRGLLRALLSSGVMVWLGKLSYGLYLWHYPIFRILRDQADWPVVLAIGLPLTLGLAWTSHVTVERWGLALRERLFPGV